MDLFPAIDLRGGRAVRLHQGDFAKETVYDDDPVARARQFADEGAPWVHVVDLDAARRQGSNRDLVARIAAEVGVPVQSGGGVHDDTLLGDGVARVVIGSLAVTDRAASAALITGHPGRIAVGIDHWDGEVRVRGWEASGGVAVEEMLGWPELAGAAAFVVTAITRDATMTGPDTDGLRQAVRIAPAPVLASGGVGSLDDLRSLRDTGVAGVVVGKAIYEGRFTVADAVSACS